MRRRWAAPEVHHETLERRSLHLVFEEPRPGKLQPSDEWILAELNA